MTCGAFGSTCRWPRGPRSTLYVARKLLRRRWPWVLAASGVLALSTAFVVRLVLERDRALQAEALAQQEAATTRQVSDFMVALFEGADPNVAGRPDLSAAELVDKGRERIDRDLQGQLALQADMKACWPRSTKTSAARAPRWNCTSRPWRWNAASRRAARCAKRLR
jgi:hypothetical protein